MMTRMSDRIYHEQFDDGPGDNPTWGAPHIQSELALLGHDLAEMDDRVRLHDQQRSWARDASTMSRTRGPEDTVSDA